MKKPLLSIAVLLIASSALAAPTLTSDPYPTTAPQPTAASITVNGQPGPSCTLPKDSQNRVTPTCDLASLPSPGQYTIVLTVSAPAGCPQPTNPATCTSGGPASSAPFSLTLGAVAAPSNLKVGAP